MTGSEEPAATPDYPSEWVADVLLSDGALAHVRPITPDDAAMLVEFYARVSPESKYLRFFAPYPVLSSADVRRFTHVDHVDRVALIMTVPDAGGTQRMIAVGRFDRIGPDEAEVAFLVEDSQQGRGIGQLLLEHLAVAARQRGIGRFVAEILPQNRRMAQVFVDAGYHVHKEFDDGVIMVEFPIHATDTAVGVMERREHRAEAASVLRLVRPRRLALIGVPDQIGVVARQVRAGGFTGELIVIGEPGAPRALAEADGEIDLAVICAPHEGIRDILLDAAYRKAHGVVVLTGGDRDTSRRPANYAEDLVSMSRYYGLRMLGPDSLGVINTDAAVAMNASPAPPPRAGVVGLVTQSSPIGVALLAAARRAAVGVSTFFSSGLYADVSVNDVMQMWEDDEATGVCVLSVDRIGNPRKFHRIVRRLARQKPVVLFSPGRSQLGRHEGVRGGLSNAPEEAIDALFRQSGVIVSDRRDAMFAIAKILARQPLPRGERVQLISNSPILMQHMAAYASRSGLIPADPVVLARDVTADGYRAAAAAALDTDADAVLVSMVDPFGLVGHGASIALEGLAETSAKPLIGVFIDFYEAGVTEQRPDGPGRLPAFGSYAEAITGLAAATAYSRWREREQGAVPMLDHDVPAARRVIQAVLRDDPDGRVCTAAEQTQILRAYGIELVPAYPVASLAEATDRATELGWNVVLKAGSARVRGQRDLAAVYRDIDDRHDLEEAWDNLATLTQQLTSDDGQREQADADWTQIAEPVVQAMLTPGVSVLLRSVEDPAFGPIISAGVAGVPEELLGDISYRVPPLTTQDARAMVRDLRAAPVLFGRHGAPGVDVGGIEDLLLRLAQLANDLPQVARCTLSPVIASTDQVAVAGARLILAPTADERDARSRRLG